MNEQTIRARIEELQANYQAGRTQLQRLQAQQDELQQTLLRISGAIQALEELLQEPDAAAPSSPQSAVPLAS
ncbi:hypothetical protein NRY95_10985 [Xanthomonas campestris pv. phormiicola]|nr:hypothetical protein [Xanthomonas campestris pv. phormiicola]UYC18432.1 hypothetical protein NRY95_10985 [Xanthomonas campestris pv. phormiicola]